MWTLTEELAIETPPRVVWDLITRFDDYERWNPWIVRASGEASEGSVIRVTSVLGNRRISVQHRILTNRAGQEFRWCDLGWFTALAYGERARFLTPLASGGTAYRVELRITGVAWRLVRRLYGRALASGLRAETTALQQRAEAIHRQAS